VTVAGTSEPAAVAAEGSGTTGAARRAEAVAAAGPELLVELRREAGGLRGQLEDGLRDAVRAARLAPGVRLPSSRALARDLGVSRRRVVEGHLRLARRRNRARRDAPPGRWASTCPTSTSRGGRPGCMRSPGCRARSSPGC
jgi:regulatory GntR family protein